jgi:hypothetical protein
MTKKVKFSKPNKEQLAENWIQSGSDEKKHPVKSIDTSKKSNKRITLDVPENWHTKIKVSCAEKGVNMSSEILLLLQKHFSLKDEV